MQSGFPPAFRFLVFSGSLLLGSVIVGPGCRQPGAATDQQNQPQAITVFGEELYARHDTSGAVRGAEAALAEAPDDVELLLAAGRARQESWQFREAIALYTRAIELAPEDWRPYTRRGIRKVSVREFDEAVTDLEKARALAPLNYDVSYYLGFAFFLQGRFDEAADELLRCFALADDPAAKAAQSFHFRSCSQIVDDVDWRLAITDWTVRSLLRAGRQGEATSLLGTVTPGLSAGQSLAYYHVLLFYTGSMTEEELLAIDPDDPYTLETVGYGVANWYLAHGETAKALEILEEIAVHPRWPGFGRIAAEVDLARLEGQLGIRVVETEP